MVFFLGFPNNRRKRIFWNIELLAELLDLLDIFLEFCARSLGVLTRIVELWWKFLELWAKNLELWGKLGLSYGKIFLSYLKIREKSPDLNTTKYINQFLYFQAGIKDGLSQKGPPQGHHLGQLRRWKNFTHESVRQQKILQPVQSNNRSRFSHKRGMLTFCVLWSI